MDSVEAEFGGRGVVGVKPAPVAAKRLKDLQQHLVDLDDLELLDRHLAIDGVAGDSPRDLADDGGVGGATGMVAEELRQKNKDLVLAARLGKALLAKNDELSLMNERLAEEYGDKLEVHDKTFIKIFNNNLITFMPSKRYWIYGWSIIFYW